MLRSNRDAKDKEILKIYREWRKLARNRYKSGEWIDLDKPYQQGWIRYYVLREDAQNRTDARYLRQALDRVNSRMFCRREDFTRRDYKTGEYRPIPQPLKSLTVEQWEKLDEKLRSIFEFHTWTVIDPIRKRKTQREGYVFKRPFYAQLRVVPNIVTQRWVPNVEMEARVAELRNKIDKNNWWPKINHLLGVRNERYHEGPWYRNKAGDTFFDSDFEQEDEYVAEASF